MATGNNLKVQLGQEATYGTVPSMAKQVKVFSEDFKYKPEKKEEGLLTGNRSVGKSEIMSKSVEAALSFLMRPDDGLLLGLALGVEADPVLVDGSTGAYEHVFDAVGSSANLPSAGFTIDRSVAAFSYSGMSVSNFSFSASPEDFLKADFSLVGREEGSGSINSSLSPSALKSFKFRHAEVKVDGVAVADVTDIKFNYDNQLESNLQTTSTGVYFRKPEPTARKITADLEVVYTAATNTLRENLFKTDDECSLEIVFTSDQEVETDVPYSLSISLPHCQVTECSANVGGSELIKQSMSLAAFESTNGLIEVTLVDGQDSKYLS